MVKCGGCANAIERLGPEADRMQLSTTVRYGKMGLIGEFSYPPTLAFTCGGMVIVATDRGLEIGEHVRLTCPGCDQTIPREKMQAYAQASSGDETYRFRNGRILRQATEADLAELRHIESTAREKRVIAQNLAREFSLEMKIVDCEQIFGGERIIFFFMSEQRVDFRQLVRRLASEFQTRIEMRQVGARDEARLLADFETCGRECCCKSFLKTLKPITMSMAKLQKTTLDLAKVSGRCGRLKCCLRFEHETYDVLNKKLPRNNSWIRTKIGVGKVIDRQVLTQLVRIKTEDDRIETIPVEDILETGLPIPPPRPPIEERPNAGQHRERRQYPPRPAPAPPPVPQIPDDDFEEAEEPSESAEAENSERQPDEGISAEQQEPVADREPPANAGPGGRPDDDQTRPRNRRGRRSRRRGRRNRPGRGPGDGGGGGGGGGSPGGGPAGGPS
jgi:cell fate regulator YaaT (PSP1 superfamily)